MGRLKEIADETDAEMREYLDHLGWEQNPFAHPVTGDEYVLPSAEDIADVSSHLQNYTGPVLIHSRYSGVGKTTLLRLMLEELGDEYQPVHVGEHNVTPYELISIVADAVGVGKSSSTKLTEQKVRGASFDQDVLLGVDEFGLNDPDTLHVIQFLNDLEPFRVILTGMTSQWDAIGGLGSEGRAFQRRVSYQLELEPFDRTQTQELVQRRIARSDGKMPSEYDQVDIEPFSERVLDEVHTQSEGVPAVVTSSLSELIGLAAYRYVNDLGSEVTVDMASSIDYPEPKVE
ncbi:AAA family ATPase [Natronosalvus rutilus]|uniref:AAA family ATPase n=1 Tax=Natronosalvus rutilus TaxID=2953753 RepID=A0A9E7SXB2_9EURY|nr:AAA family ATPase [Natronosalvus rutilus]UTF55992.1 AAA family ATPase [Natronosalvus rutilus]